jgi:glycosyltransferase involved in cell wall biosynthesis
MRIAYAHDAIYPFVKGGAEKRLYEISRRLAERGHEVHVFGMKWWDGADVVDNEGVSLHGVCPSTSLYSKGRRSIRAAATFSKSLLPHLMRVRFDVIDCYQAPYLHFYPTKLVSHLKRAPLTVTWHEVWREYWNKYLGRLGVVGKIMEKNILLGLADHIIAVSDQTKDDLVSLGVKENKISIVPNGINYSWMLDVPPSKGELDVVYLGRLIKPKNVDVLLRSVGLLREEFPGLKVGIIGDGPEKPQLEKLSEEIGVTENVKFFGFIEDFGEVVGLMKSSKVFVIPSIQEGGASIVTQEANACGLPVIAIDHPLGIDKRLIREEKNGFFVKLAPEAIADKIRVLLKDRELRERMAKSAKEFAKQFDWEKITDLIEGVYKEIAES